MFRPKITLAICITILSFFMLPAFADSSDEAEKLKDDALQILKANANRNASADEYASCILKLEKAQDMLESTGKSNGPLAQEVGSTLFWARKFSDVNVVAALERMRRNLPPRPVSKTEPAKIAVSIKTTKPDSLQAKSGLLEARDAYLDAESFAREHSGDDYMISLRWFQMASEHPGTDYSIKALILARSAQLRFTAKSGTNEELPNSPEMNLVKQGDELASAGKFDEAVAIYKASEKIKETLVVHRRLANAYFNRARQIRDELLPKLEACETALVNATRDAYVVHRTMGGDEKRFNPNYPPLLDAQKKQADLHKQGHGAIEYFNNAESEFKAVLRLAPSGKDLDSEGHIALCWMSRDDASIRARARLQLLKVLSDYKPVNDMERSLYEFCKTAVDQYR